MKPIDILDMGPSRAEVYDDASKVWTVTVTPPAWSQFKGSNSVKLGHEQFTRYLAWRDGTILIQDALPDLTAEQREILMTGLDSSDFDTFKEEEEDGA